MTMNSGSLAIDHFNHNHDQQDDQNDENHLAVKMAGQIRAIHKRRKVRAQRTRSRRR